MRRRDDSGAAAVEFALVAPLLFLLICATLYGVFNFYYAAVSAHVARAVARDASIPHHGSYPTAAEEQVVAANVGGAMIPTPTSVTLNPDPAVGEGNTLTVNVTYDLPLLGYLGSAMPFLPIPSSVVTRSVTVRYE
jgi:Flp pilus assembly protein TadG